MRPPGLKTGPQLTSARQAAARARAQVVLEVAGGRRGVLDVLDAACEPDGIGLRRLTLLRLLRATGRSQTGATRLIEQAIRIYGADPEQVGPRRVTLAWFVDTRSGGMRYRALADVLARDAKHNEGRTDPWAPWPGFPYSRPPAWASGGGSA